MKGTPPPRVRQLEETNAGMLITVPLNLPAAEVKFLCSHHARHCHCHSHLG